MSAPRTEPDRWQHLEAELHTWRDAHPAATFTELEAAVDARLDALRATLLGDLASEGPITEERCPHCGGPLVTRGRHRRSLVTDGGQTVAVTRPYATCPVCGTGLFPPSINAWACIPAVDLHRGWCSSSCSSVPGCHLNRCRPPWPCSPG